MYTLEILTVHFVSFFASYEWASVSYCGLQMTYFFAEFWGNLDRYRQRVFYVNTTNFAAWMRNGIRRCAGVIFIVYAGSKVRIWSGTRSPHCVLSQIGFYETLNLRLRSRGGSPEPALDAPLPGTLLSPTFHGKARSEKFCVSNCCNAFDRFQDRR